MPYPWVHNSVRRTQWVTWRLHCSLKSMPVNKDVLTWLQKFIVIKALCHLQLPIVTAKIYKTIYQHLQLIPEMSHNLASPILAFTVRIGSEPCHACHPTCSRRSVGNFFKMLRINICTFQLCIYIFNFPWHDQNTSKWYSCISKLRPGWSWISAVILASGDSRKPVELL